MEILLANNVDPDQMPHYVASDLGLHCLPICIDTDEVAFQIVRNVSLF